MGIICFCHNLKTNKVYKVCIFRKGMSQEICLKKKPKNNFFAKISFFEQKIQKFQK